MHFFANLLDKINTKAFFYLNLPVLSAVLLETHLHFLLLRANDGSEYLLIAVQLIFECLPLFTAHYFAVKEQAHRFVSIWLLGFFCYPLLSFLVSVQNTQFGDWTLLNIQGWLFAVIASMSWFVNRAVKRHHQTRAMQVISRLFSLNTVFVLLLIGWAMMMAGIFNSQGDPMYNRPLNSVIDVGKVFIEYDQFFEYLWQFLVVAGLIGCVYSINRYGLIRQTLAKQGVLAFVMAALVCIIVVTPIFAEIVLWLPLNSPDMPLLPSENHNVFEPINYQIVFWLLAISTPIILAFERQQQDTELAQIAQQQTRTELKMLQQQINPHFLFNALNNLYALSLTKSDDAPHLIMQLSNLLRYTVYEGQKEWVSLSQEVSYLQNYIALQKIRTGDKCTIDVKWPEQNNTFSLPPLLIIILLENAFKYGVEPTIKKTYIRFHMQLHENTLSLVCENPIFANTKDEEGGLGLENLSRRLMLLYPGRHKLNSGPKGDLWCAELTLELSPC